jgi:hypothetical protein
MGRLSFPRPVFFILIQLASMLIFPTIMTSNNSHIYANALSSQPNGINCGINPRAPPCCVEPTSDPACEATSKILLNNVGTVPPIVHVNDTFAINATVFNGSPNVINIRGTNTFCNNPLRATFDKNVQIVHGPLGPACIPLPPNGYALKPNQSLTLSTKPTRGIIAFLANSAGMTTANVQLEYQIKNQSFVLSKCIVNEKILTSPCLFQFPILKGTQAK